MSATSIPSSLDQIVEWLHASTDSAIAILLVGTHRQKWNEIRNLVALGCVESTGLSGRIRPRKFGHAKSRSVIVLSRDVARIDDLGSFPVSAAWGLSAQRVGLDAEIRKRVNATRIASE
jgi:hypothetical protein